MLISFPVNMQQVFIDNSAQSQRASNQLMFAQYTAYCTRSVQGSIKGEGMCMICNFVIYIDAFPVFMYSTVHVQEADFLVIVLWTLAFFTHAQSGPCT